MTTRRTFLQCLLALLPLPWWRRTTGQFKAKLAYASKSVRPEVGFAFQKKPSITWDDAQKLIPRFNWDPVKEEFEFVGFEKSGEMRLDEVYRSVFGIADPHATRDPASA